MNSASMTSTGAVTFLFSYASIALSVLVLGVTAGLCFYAWRRSGYRRDYGAIELLRFVIAVLAVVLFNQPEWVEQFKPKEKPSIGVLWDNSRSMETRDVGVAGKATRAAKTEDPHPSPLPKGEGTVDRPVCVKMWGEQGQEPGRLSYPYDILLDEAAWAGDDSGFVYICEFGNHRVQKFTRNGQFAGSFGHNGRREGELDQPWGIARDSRGRMYVLDTYNHRVQRFRL